MLWSGWHAWDAAVSKPAQAGTLAGLCQESYGAITPERHQVNSGASAVTCAPDAVHLAHACMQAHHSVQSWHVQGPVFELVFSGGSCAQDTDTGKPMFQSTSSMPHPFGLIWPDEVQPVTNTVRRSAGVVTCVQPLVSLQKTPGGCNLKYTSSDVIQVSAAHTYFPCLLVRATAAWAALSHFISQRPAMQL